MVGVFCGCLELGSFVEDNGCLLLCMGFFVFRRWECVVVLEWNLGRELGKRVWYLDERGWYLL